MRQNPSRDIDDIAVERLVMGTYSGNAPTSAELDEAVRILARRGYSLTETAETIGCSTRAVSRHRRRLREMASA